MSVEERLSKLEALVGVTPVTDSGWVDLGTAGAWVSTWGPHANSTYRPMIRRFATGLVLMRGLVVKGTALTGASENIISLYRPWWPGDSGYATAGLSMIYEAANNAGTAGDIRMNDSGVLSLVTGSAVYTSLAGVIYTVLR